MRQRQCGPRSQNISCLALYRQSLPAPGVPSGPGHPLAQKMESWTLSITNDHQRPDLTHRLPSWYTWLCFSTQGFVYQKGMRHSDLVKGLIGTQPHPSLTTCVSPGKSLPLPELRFLPLTSLPHPVRNNTHSERVLGTGCCDIKIRDSSNTWC